MRKLSDTIARLTAMHNAAFEVTDTASAGRFSELRDFGSNPGMLKALTYLPKSLGGNAPLVVVLHGCTQSAAGYDIGAGWSEMADLQGFALLFPEQQRQNNPNLCFNWFSPEDSRRGSGEALSIRQMIGAVVDTYGIDPSRIFVTGLSAGGAMTSVMLATYPDVFAGGAVIAGLPYGCAATIPQAFDRMRGQGMPREARLSTMVRDATDHAGPWPILSVWHGSGDATVNPANATSIVGQWRALHGANVDPDLSEPVDGYPRRVWHDQEGREVIEEYSITGMGHGTPLDTLGDDGCGRAGPYMLDVGISSTRHICRFWDLLKNDAVDPRVARVDSEAADRQVVPLRRASKGDGGLSAADDPQQRKTSPADQTNGIGRVIEDALRAAGLMR